MLEDNKLIIYTKEIPAKKGQYCDIPKQMDEAIVSFLKNKGIERLYVHQGEMFSLAWEGANVVITTSTASGKTLSFLLPVLQKLMDNPGSRAIFVYPTKALAADQLRVMNEVVDFFGDKLAVGVYDGDTLPAERTRIRKTANIILTNPEMLNGAFLPNHSKYGFDGIFSNLSYVVIDELHSYRGAFGAHLANIMRRLKRVCNYYHSKPQFLCSSATIANPLELAANVCGEEFALVSRDGAPTAGKTYHIVQPPNIKGKNDKVYGRRTAASVAAELIPELVEKESHFIAFGRSRRNVEVVLKESRDVLNASGFLGKGYSDRIAGYRGGYTPKERKDIEKRMMSGQLLGLVSTNALELGIDIGALDATVLVGYPGTRASFWQQTGRAGRSGADATNYMILENAPFDQYIAIDPDWLFEQQSENAIVDPNNLLIELAHIRAAAAEMPLSLDDMALFPDLGEVIPVLMKAEEVKSLSGRFAWTGPAYPAGDYSLRNMDKSRFKMIDVTTSRTITEMDEGQAHHELYPGAIYLHDGEQYEILKLDLVTRTAEGKPFSGDYYTVPTGEKHTRVIHKMKEDELERAEMHFGDINIDELVLGFKKLQFHNHQNLGYVDLTLPLEKDYDTESTWITIPSNVVDMYRRLLVPNENGTYIRNNHFEGLAHAIKTAAMMVSMTEQSDIDVIVSNNATIPDAYETEDEQVSLYIYDKYEGGLGYSEKIYDLMPAILQNAAKLVKGCSCEDGCPACVGDYTLDKKLVAWGIENFFEESEAPVSDKMVKEPEQPAVQKEFSFYKLEEQWEWFLRKVATSGEAGAGFLKTVRSIKIKGDELQLVVESQFMKEWFEQGNNRRSIENILRYYAVCPGSMRVTATVRTDDDFEQEHKKKEGKLNRHYDRILKPTDADETIK